MSRLPHVNDRLGVLLFNLGGPETLDDVRPFLFNLFSDPDIIRLPWRAMQKPLAWLISTQRYKKSRGYYEKIGGGSPLRSITDQQAEALRAALAEQYIDARVYVGMRYWKPFIEEALDQIVKDRITRLVVLPLYPQFSVSTTGSSLNRMKALIEANGMLPAEISVIESWHTDPAYIAALSATVAEELAQLPERDPSQTHILFSAHSVPVSYIEAGDPYLEHTRETVALVMRELGDRYAHSLAFQSKVGPVKWLQPATGDALKELTVKGASHVVLVPVSFVSEHIETLYELDILYRDLAREIGLPHYRRAPALNCRPDFIDALAGLVVRSMRSET
jgi:ferrochelatase